MKAAPALGLMDIPADDRRMHDKPIPRMGGVAIYLAFLISMSVFGFFEEMLPYAVGGLIIVIVGILDDRNGLKPSVKILGQIIAGVVVCAFGITAQSFTLFGFTIDVGYFAYPLTVIWIVAVTNIFNLIDGLDGLCCGITVLAGAGLALTVYFGVPDGTVFDGIMPAVLVFVFSCLGFLPHNVNPAKIFLGDTGAMLCGFMLAVSACSTVFSPQTGDAVSAVTPIVLFGIPVFDSCFAVVRRLASGSGVFRGDKKHVHHRLSERYGQSRSVLLMYLGEVVLVGIAFISNISLAGEIVGAVLLALALAYAIIRFGVYKK